MLRLLFLWAILASTPLFAAADLTMTEFIRSPTYATDGSGAAASQPPVTAGNVIRVTGTHKNIGNTTATTNKVRFYLSSSNTYSAAAIELGFVNGQLLAPNAMQYIVEKTLTIPATTAVGSYFVLCRVDADAQISENSENNNLFNFALPIIVLPDLIIQTPTAPASITKGSSGTIGCVVRNNATTSSGSSILRYYLSTNQTFENTDISLGSSTVTTIAANGSLSRTCIVTIAASTTPGNYYLLYRADAQGQVVEKNETNNIGVKSVIIQ